MSNAWERARNLAEKHAQAGGIFVRLANDGDKVVGAFCGEPHTREVVWTGERYETYDPEQPAHGDKRPSLRVMINLFVPAEDKMKVIEGGTQWFKDVCKVRDKYGLDNWLFEIERHGESGDTKTKYTILPETKIDGDLRARLSAEERDELPSIGEGDGEGEHAEPTPRAGAKPAAPKPAAAPATKATPAASKGASGAIDPSVAAQLVEQLKALPRAELDAFL